MPEKALVEESFDDLFRRYKNGWFVIDPDTAPRLALIYEIEENRPAPLAYLMFTNNEKVAGPISDFNLKEMYPEKGLYNLGFHKGPRDLPWRQVVYFTRRPRRQWAHGIRNETCHVLPVFAQLIQNLMPFPAVEPRFYFQANVLEDIFSPWYPKDVKQIFGYLEKNPQVALNKDFGIIKSWFDHTHLLFRQYQFIGTIDKELIHLKEPLLEQEIIDMVKRNKLDLGVRVER